MGTNFSTCKYFKDNFIHMATIISRIKQVADSLNISIRQLERDINASHGSVQKAITRDADVGAELVRTICSRYAINPVWLLTDTGEMKMPLPQGMVKEPVVNYAKKAKEPDVIYINLDERGNKPIPILDIQASAGYPMEIGKPEFLKECPVLSISWPQFQQGENIMIQIKGPSMEETLYHGDWVICRRLNNPIEEIRDGYIHVIVTGRNEGGEVVCKRLLTGLAVKATSFYKVITLSLLPIPNRQKIFCRYGRLNLR